MFLHGFLKETVLKMEDFRNGYALNCALYGLKQAPLLCLKGFPFSFLVLGFVSSKAGSSLFVLQSAFAYAYVCG